MANISVITLPDGSSKNIKDATARSQIQTVADQTTKYNLLNQAAYTELRNVTYNNGVVTQVNADTRSNLVMQLTLYNGSTFIVQLAQATVTSNGVVAIPFTYGQTGTLIRIGHSGANTDARIVYAVPDDFVVNGDYYFVCTVTNCTQTIGGVTTPYSWQNMAFIPKSLYDAGFTDYQPYAFPNTALTTATTETYDRVCSKNLLQVTKDDISSRNSGTWSGNVFTPAGQTGLTMTVSDDGTITTNGAPSAGVYISLSVTLNSILNVGETYVLSGCTGGSASTYGLYTGDQGVWDNFDGGTAKVYTSSITSIYLYVRASANVTGIVFKPMICTKADWDISHDYVPYNTLDGTTLPMTVKELSDADGQKNLLSVNQATVSADGWVISATGITLNAGTKYVFSYTNSQAIRLNLVGYSDYSSSTRLIDLTITSTENTAGRHSFEIIPTGNIGVIALYGNNVTSSTTLTDVMICTKAQWDISHEYQPYALPNVKLTPALIECVDSGKKNLAKFTSPQSLITVNGCTITVNGTVSSTGSRWLWEGQVDNGTYAFAVNYKSGNITTSLYNATDDTNVKSFTGTSGVEFVNLVSGKTYKIGMYMSTGSTITGQEDIMLCEKSLWDVSQKFVPYAMDNAELTVKEQTNEDNISISPKVIYYVSQSISATTTLDNTGVHFNIPSYHTVRLTANIAYSATGTNPVEIVLATVSGQAINTVMAHSITVTGDNVSNLATTALIGGYNNDMDVYVWAKVKTAGTAFVRLIAESIPNPN